VRTIHVELEFCYIWKTDRHSSDKQMPALSLSFRCAIRVITDFVVAHLSRPIFSNIACSAVVSGFWPFFGFIT